MAKQISVGVGGVVKKAAKVRVGVGGVVKTVKKGVCGIGGVVREFFGSEMVFTSYNTIRVDFSRTSAGLYVYSSTDGKSSTFWIYGDFANKTYSFTIRCYSKSPEISYGPTSNSGSVPIKAGSSNPFTITGTFTSDAQVLEIHQDAVEDDINYIRIESFIIDGEECLEKLKALVSS